MRLTGSGLDDVLRRVVEPFSGWPVPPSRPRRVRLVDASGVYDDGVLLIGRAPSTATGEDLAEITCHGNPLVVERLLAAASTAGARVAEPGEFTRRALLNGRIDLVEAEAVLQVAEASTARGLQIARDGFDGRIAEHFGATRARLLEVGAELEARLDYPADELAFEDDAQLVDTLARIGDACRELAQTYEAGRVFVRGARVALVGPVNAGKSSLFNALLGRRRALVHDAPGTTRDVLEVACAIEGLPITLLDTAGERATDDPVEAAGLALARELVDEADLLLVVLRARADGPDPVEVAILERTEGRPRRIVYNGVDRAGVAAPPPDSLPTVATTGEGIEALRRAIAGSLVGETARSDQLLIASARQRDRLLGVADAVDEAIEALPIAGVAVASDAVHRAIAAIDELTGADTREHVLDALFARFCIGK